MRFRQLTIADLPALQDLHARAPGSGILATWDASRLGMRLFDLLLERQSELVAILGVMGARVGAPRTFVKGRPKAFVLGLKVPAALGTSQAVQVELLTVDPAFQTWRGRPVAALLIRAIAEQTGLPVQGLSPDPPALAPPDNAPVPAGAVDRPSRDRRALCRDGGGARPHVSRA